MRRFPDGVFGPVRVRARLFRMLAWAAVRRLPDGRRALSEKER